MAANDAPPLPWQQPAVGLWSLPQSFRLTAYGYLRLIIRKKTLGKHSLCCHYWPMDDRYRAVYSTELGQVGKSMEKSGGKKKKQQVKPTAVIKNPAKQGVRIRRESKGRGGKSVSVIDGLPLGQIELKALLKKLKASLGCGGALKGDELEIQGDHREKLLLLLAKEGHKAKLSGG
ncbi:MAG: hypothetical protein R8K50_07090 [Mariprofundus sp.]